MTSKDRIQQDVRINFKDSLATFFITFSGLQAKTARVMGLNHAKRGGVHVLFFVFCLRLDTANHTVILDSAVCL